MYWSAGVLGVSGPYFAEELERENIMKRKMEKLKLEEVRRLAEAGDAEAQFELGCRYQYGWRPEEGRSERLLLWGTRILGAFLGLVLAYLIFLK